MFTLNSKGRLWVVDKPQVMGILNITPDSFYAGSRFDTSAAVEQAGAMLEAGAALLDIGGQSTRSGSRLLSATEEQERVLPVVATIRQTYPSCWISVDTFYAAVAREAVAAGADMVNDISAGLMDPSMLETVAALQVPYILMHMKGTPQTMQADPVYENVTLEVLDFLIERIAACKRAGVRDLVIDPGFGFGKTISHNFRLLKELSAFKVTGLPILAGLSRKSTIYKTLGTDAAGALNGTTVLNTLALLNGASLLRVHDVKEALETVILTEAYRQA